MTKIQIDNFIRSRKGLRTIFLVSFIAVVVAVFGHGCGGMKTEKSSLASLGACGAEATAVVTDPGQQAASIVYGSQVLDNMVACTGLQTPSARTLEEFEARRPAFSEYGNVGDVTAPMMMGVAALAIEVCNDLMGEESARLQAQRHFATDFADLSARAVADSTLEAGLENAFDRFAMNCWQRVATDEEKIMATQEVRNIVSDGGDITNREALVMICTSVLGSLDGIRM